LLATNYKREICIWKNFSSPPQKLAFLEKFYDTVVLPFGTYQTTNLYNGSHYALVDISSNEIKPVFVFPEDLDLEVFSPGGKYLAALNKNGAKFSIFRVADQTLITEFQDPVSFYAFSFDDKLFATMAGNKILIYDTSSWKNIASIEVEFDKSPDYHPFYFELHFSPDGHYLVWNDDRGNTTFLSVNGK
jgi:uncharacterized protein with WD repeat